YGKTRTGAVCGLLRASFYHGAKIRNSAVLPLRETCWGVPSPNPALRPCGRKKRKRLLLFSKKFSNERNREISPPKIRKNSAIGINERRFTAHAKAIQHTPPQPRCENPADRR